MCSRCCHECGENQPEESAECGLWDWTWPADISCCSLREGEATETGSSFSRKPGHTETFVMNCIWGADSFSVWGLFGEWHWGVATVAGLPCVSGHRQVCPESPGGGVWNSDGLSKDGLLVHCYPSRRLSFFGGKKNQALSVNMSRRLGLCWGGDERSSLEIIPCADPQREAGPGQQEEACCLVKSSQGAQGGVSLVFRWLLKKSILISAPPTLTLPVPLAPCALSHVYIHCVLFWHDIFKPLIPRDHLILSKLKKKVLKCLTSDYSQY